MKIIKRTNPIIFLYCDGELDPAELTSTRSETVFGLHEQDFSMKTLHA